MSTQVFEASAPSNIALIKYWGKRSKKWNLPLTSSFSVTLQNMRSWAKVQKAEGKEDQWDIMGDPSKAQKVLAAARLFTNDQTPLRISIHNDFPSGAGLASSASSMAALALALGKTLCPDVPTEQLAHWSRLGSGSSVRSLYPGYVLWEAGEHPEGLDCVARSEFSANHLPLSLVVCVVDDQPKPIGSTKAMERCRETSPNYDAFHKENPKALKAAIQAVQQKDLKTLGELSEQNCLAMHDVMHKASPPIQYFKPGTYEAMEQVKILRAEGIPCFFTIDAGPNVKILCPPEHQQAVHEACKSLSGLKKILLDQVSDAV